MERNTLEVTPELLEAMQVEQREQARRVKEANLGASSVKILEELYNLIKCNSHYERRETIKKVNKYCVKWLKTEATS